MRIPKVLIALFVTLLISGCFQYEETIRFNRDGSGTVSARLIIPEATLNLLVANGDSSQYDLVLSRLSHRSLDDHVRRHGISITNIERHDTDSGLVAVVDYEFTDIEAFRRTRNDGRDVSLMELEDGLYELRLVFSTPVETMPVETARSGPEAEAISLDIDASQSPDALRNALSTLQIHYELHMPTRVVSAPGARFGAQSAVYAWSYDRGGFPASRPREMRVIFARNGLNWPTFEAVSAIGDEVPFDQNEWSSENAD